MGVTGLWTVLQPCARPIKIETLNRKRLAVDASIWIYQFLKAVRDKEGNALRNSHVVGFFRRICKLLFFGIKPVFVFDGGAPALKRETISGRKRRREGRREDAVRTAGKLLAVQMQRRAQEEEDRRKERSRQPVEEELPEEGLVYVDELQMSQAERQQNRKFKKKDAYHLPDLDVSMHEMGGPNDPRVMSLEDLQQYAEQFSTGEEGVNVYDFNKIDYDSPFFTSLPASDRYNILNAARLRSRLRMGHSKEQLDTMFPDRMAFSKFQIERVTERNELTQRLMHINGPNDDAMFGINGSGRVAGEKGREYVLVKNDGVEGGWALGVVSNDKEHGRRNKPIDLESPKEEPTGEDEQWDEEDGFEDVPIEGLNRLPKRPVRDLDDEAARQRRALYASRRRTARRQPGSAQHAEDPNSLFVADEAAEDANESDWEELDANAELFGEEDSEAENKELERAIALSLQEDQSVPRAENDEDTQRAIAMSMQHDGSDAEDNDYLEGFKQNKANEARPLPKGTGRAIAHVINNRAVKDAPESREVTSFGVPVLKSDSDSDDDTMDFQAALAESRKSKRKASSPRRQAAKPAASPNPVARSKAEEVDTAKDHGFSGPLPFEKLDLGSSLLGKNKLQQRTEEASGGFVNPSLAEEKKTEPLPPWFEGNLEEDMAAQRKLEAQDRERRREFDRQFQFHSPVGLKLRRQKTEDAIDLEMDQEMAGGRREEPIDVDDDNEAGGDVKVIERIVPVDLEIRMGDMADAVRVSPPIGKVENHAATPSRPSQKHAASSAIQMDDNSEDEDEFRVFASASGVGIAPADAATTLSPPPTQMNADERQSGVNFDDQDEEMIDWSESDDEKGIPRKPANAGSTQPADDVLQPPISRSPSMVFENVGIPDAPQPPQAAEIEIDGTNPDVDDVDVGIFPASGTADQDAPFEDFEDFSDPEDEELMRQLAVEAEEHARFASQLNPATTQAQNIAEYERELKQLRNQQRKDRRDADEVTHIMIQECQQLLRLFGLPYITAPMEAEAQCAELVSLGLVDGIVTDDSDCFLFGGTRVYKNMFNQAKFVECYLNSDLEKEFGLNRRKLIRIALLLGSDYTEGLPGVGPVTALEILSEFPTLEEFKAWWTGVQMGSIPKSADASNPFRKKFRRNATKLFLPPTFPDQRVELAYTNPEVDNDPSAFQWGVPDLESLRSFLMATIGWTQERTDEVLVPVIKDMNRRADEGTQANITAFFAGGAGAGAFAPRKKAEGSKRMGSALNRMAEHAKNRRQSTLNGEEDGPQKVSNPFEANSDTEATAESSRVSNGTVKASRKRKKAPQLAATPASEEDSIGDDGDADFAATSRKQRKLKPTHAIRGRRKKDVASRFLDDR